MLALRVRAYAGATLQSAAANRQRVTEGRRAHRVAQGCCWSWWLVCVMCGRVQRGPVQANGNGKQRALLSARHLIDWYLGGGPRREGDQPTLICLTLLARPTSKLPLRSFTEDVSETIVILHQQTPIRPNVPLPSLMFALSPAGHLHRPSDG
ncbi:hypothetical protein P171DRAFT_221508 [Karstenula rhodostoma CBS 690.94]|uniref:Uncharacterized protein n=1 Tax=Karstenula rhodostoma CBS 690.94 TaxID=1392251 RepID=A0A9P4PPI2_9PLEO|nr:hypothetical protein P171DRAFT_221508 [Karstenula rhodostoma CBS 690.94]